MNVHRERANMYEDSVIRDVYINYILHPIYNIKFGMKKWAVLVFRYGRYSCILNGE